MPDIPEKPALRAGRPFLSTTGGLVAAALFCNLLWGSAISVTRGGYAILGIAENDPAGQLVFAGVRFLLSGVAIIAFWSVCERRLPRYTARELWEAFRICLFWTVGQYFCYYLGIAHATGVSTSLIQGFEVFVALVVSACLFHSERLTTRKVAGSLIGVAGLALFNWGGQVGFTWQGEGILVCGTVFAAVASVMTADYGSTWDPVLLAGTQFAMGGAVLWLIGAAMGGSIRLDGVPALTVLLWLVFVSSVAYSLWSVLLTRHPVSSVVAFSFTQPFFGVTIALVTLGDEGDPFGLRGVFALVLICLGIWLVDRPEKARRGA
ncbi:DMT family transporter [Olsenella sp. YH-ols2217]|uniref:DMT family transporter n=1 Tax=Kribbibacterium absianum TaxID=3044210 RepID=A0ABT6ZKZ8_9ACTN|nr:MULTISPECIES: DMT family transporter [unclassified Olsenella]MDJ1121718.1 DMT family transporter [Olsenella sp. YH-ols2216]MDJ1129726.1 DMT family transporter [Olsenella sp. YH-ols2217]